MAGKIPQAMKMPEFQIFAKSLAVGFVGAEVLRIASYLGRNFSRLLIDLPLWQVSSATALILLLCIGYLFCRGALNACAKIVSSARLDLFIATSVGVWMNFLIEPGLSNPHKIVATSAPGWAPAILLLLCATLMFPLVQWCQSTRARKTQQLYFLNDVEIDDETEDVLANREQAKSFAETVLRSGSHDGLVFGVDGPWGIGKTSFINLASRYWEADKNVIVCRFEPLRYASEPDLTDRLIRDLSSAIQRRVFAPEFRPAASRYSRWIKGKADLSFLGFKLSLEPSAETVDELLDDIDDVLRRIGRRVIIVIDDLDRLDSKTANNVLFATRRTFRLSQATYILCYDTETLASKSEDGSKAREFLEKFITAKLSLFVDVNSILSFLRQDWNQAEGKFSSIPSDAMLKLSGVLSELANILEGKFAADYLPLVGDLRKVKRFTNAMLLMQIEKSDLTRTDFHNADLINLFLINLHFPGLFRKIYAEETEGRRGRFSVRRESGTPEYKNSPEFASLLKDQEPSAAFLLKQLFDVTILDFGTASEIDEAILSSRACFNHGNTRNLEAYLKLLVRFQVPELQQTFVLYQNAVERVKRGEKIISVLTSPEFQLEQGERLHDEFWRVLVNQSQDLTQAVADDAIDTLVDYLPRYSALETGGRRLRQTSIYSLVRLLNHAGWGRRPGRRVPNSPENVIEIAWRIFGESTYTNRGLIQRLTENERGALGWYDLMLFRLQCSEDRQGQIYNVYSALIFHQDMKAQTSGLVSELALIGMREISQKIFSHFHQTYISPQRNFFSEVGQIPREDILGYSNKHSIQYPENLDLQVEATRSAINSFVIYQLSNVLPATGAGVGCGIYDLSGSADGYGIAKQMNAYVLDICFNPDIHQDNCSYFIDFCLSNLSNSLFLNSGEDGYFASKTAISGCLDRKAVAEYWTRHQKVVRMYADHHPERRIITLNYQASYLDDLPGVFLALDELATEVFSAGVE